MLLKELWQGWFGRSATGRRVRQAGPRRRGLRLNLERLEERTLLSDFTAANVPELIAAINAANLTAEADTIALVAGTTFTLTQVNNTTNGDTGLPTIAANSGNLTILGNGGVIERSGTPAFRLFDVAAAASLTLENLTLQGGLGAVKGGAIHNQGTLTLQGVTVQNNRAFGYSAIFPRSALGGGIYSSGSLTLQSSTIQNNQATGGSGGSAVGGGIYSSGSLTLQSSTIQNNQATGGTGGKICDRGRCNGTQGGSGIGGGLYVDGTAALSGVTLVSNSAQGGTGGSGSSRGGAPGRGGSGGDGLGGGMYAAGATVTVRDSRVTENAANGGAGGSGRPRGSPGQGIGGGLYIEADALVCLDAETNVQRNRANTDPNIHGPYTICP